MYNKNSHNLNDTKEKYRSRCYLHTTDFFFFFKEGGDHAGQTTFV